MILFSLPFNSPIPFPILVVNPPVNSSNILDQYHSILYAAAATTLTPKIRLENWIKSLLSTPHLPPTILRQIILPLHSFDFKWRNAISRVISNSTNPTTQQPLNKEDRHYILSEVEQSLLLNSHTVWLQSQSSHLGQSQPSNWSIITTLYDWLTCLELFETQLQCCILLTLISISFPDTTTSPLPSNTNDNDQDNTKPMHKKRKNPERHAASLDPELLLDFLTDRLQIWRLMKQVNGLGTKNKGTTSGQDVMMTTTTDTRIEPDRDEVQEWWEDVVEVLFTARLPLSLLAHHRNKLFPSSSATLALSSSRSLPAPSPFKVKDRSLLSLDKSARRRESQPVAGMLESPTMKRLIARNYYPVGTSGGMMGREEKNTSSASNSASTTTMVGGEVFKLPAPRRRTLGTTATKEEIMMNSGPTIGVDPIRKPIRSLPARSASSSSIMNSGATVGGSSKALFNNTRNEVSLTRRPGHVTKAVKDVVVGVAVPAVRRKRKSVSPKKSTASSSSTILVMNTPSKPLASSSRTSFTRTTSLPSFAALGAAFRPGAHTQVQLPAFIPAPPRDVFDDDSDENGMDDEMMRWGAPSGPGGGTPAAKEVVNRPGGWYVPDTPG